MYRNSVSSQSSNIAFLYYCMVVKTNLCIDGSYCFLAEVFSWIEYGTKFTLLCNSLVVFQNNILLEFDAGQYEMFWKLWDDHVPHDIRTKDYTCQRLEFYVQIHFAVYPIRISSIGAVSNFLCDLYFEVLSDQCKLCIL